MKKIVGVITEKKEYKDYNVLSIDNTKYRDYSKQEFVIGRKYNIIIDRLYVKAIYECGTRIPLEIWCD